MILAIKLTDADALMVAGQQDLAPPPWISPSVEKHAQDRLVAWHFAGHNVRRHVQMVGRLVLQLETRPWTRQT